MHPQTVPVIPVEIGQATPAKRFLPRPKIEAIGSYREAVRLAFEHRASPGMTQRTLAEICDLYAPHVSSYLHESELDEKGRPRLDLPAKKIAAFQRAVGNDIVAQYLAYQWSLSLMEEYMAWRQVAA
jgi:hypothetical protein